MTTSRRRTYWDANLFLEYVNRASERLVAIDQLVAEARAGEAVIGTSIFSVTEAAYSTNESLLRALNPQVELSFDRIFRSLSYVTVIPIDYAIAVRARTLVRQAMVLERSLRPADAIHLASAEAFGADLIYSYDRPLSRRSAELDSVPVREPAVP